MIGIAKRRKFGIMGAGRVQTSAGGARVPGFSVTRSSMPSPRVAVALIAAAAATTLAAGGYRVEAYGKGGQQRFKAGVDLVHFSVIVTDKQGSPITGLKPGDFEVVEEGKAQNISYF